MELHVVEQGIDTSTMEGRAMFGMLSVLAEPQRELVVADTNDGLAAARARVGGRRPGLTRRRLDQARKTYDGGTHIAEAIARNSRRTPRIPPPVARPAAR
ncbi:MULTISPECIES: recombinase family protein [Streptosporangium]|uniref:recombinase family protein n=1 Tax=Streptosporangium TaxID=2000 RepID=UPI0031F99983